MAELVVGYYSSESCEWRGIRFGIQSCVKLFVILTAVSFSSRDPLKIKLSTSEIRGRCKKLLSHRAVSRAVTGMTGSTAPEISQHTSWYLTQRPSIYYMVEGGILS